jgi:hypothetical protein
MEEEAVRMRSEVQAIFDLSGDDFRNAVLRNAVAFAHEVRTLTDDARARLIDVLGGAWPERGVAANIERTENTLTFHDPGAAAWLVLAPALDVVPTSEQWADIATSGAVLTDTSGWLSRHYTEEAALLAANSCQANDARPWGDLIAAIPTDVPPAVVEALVEHASESTAEHHFDLRAIGSGFVQAGRLDALQTLSAKNETFERALRTCRAQLGEVESAHVLLKELTEALEAGRFGEIRIEPGPRPGRTHQGPIIRAAYADDDPEWLEGVRSAELLPDLFGALQLAALIDEDIPRPLVSALIHAIHRIGGEEAVQLYDELIIASNDSRFTFLRIQRNEVVQAELRMAGQRAATSVAERVGVPILQLHTDIPPT